MKNARDAKLGLIYSIMVILVLFISACAAKLVDIDKSLPRLNLSEEQIEVVKPKMEAIRNMVDSYNEKKEQFEEEMAGMMSGDRGSEDRSERQARMQEFREKREELSKTRETYLSAINIHITEIKAVLNEDQLVTFEKMKVPELEMPETPAGRRSGGGSRGGGTGKGGGMDRGGGRRGGSMF